jgi:hypothetical protein
MKKLILSILILSTAIFACKHQPDDTTSSNNNGGGNNGGGTDTIPYVNPHPCDPDTVYFTNTILPLVLSNCAMSGCHDATTHAEGVRLYDYAHISNYVTPGSPNNSELYAVLFDGMPPSGPLSAAERNQIYTWIMQGGLNNSCIADCDPNATISYAALLWPIVQANCTGCHSGSNPSGGVSLTNYATVSASANNGSLMNTLTGNGASIMPPSTSGLPACQIEQFQSWVDAGAPNN